jgi:hypothetical protein
MFTKEKNKQFNPDLLYFDYSRSQLIVLSLPKLSSLEIVHLKSLIRLDEHIFILCTLIKNRKRTFQR